MLPPFKGGRGDLNPSPLDSQSSMLTNTPRPPYQRIVLIIVIFRYLCITKKVSSNISSNIGRTCVLQLKPPLEHPGLGNKTLVQPSA